MKLFKRLSLLLPVLMMLLLATQCATPECVEKSVKVLPNDFSAAMLANPEGLVLDVRTADEFNAGHLEGAVQMDFYSNDFAQQLEQLDRNTEVFLYCKSGGRSSKAHAMMEQLCFKNITELSGGFDGWYSKGMPSVK